MATLDHQDFTFPISYTNSPIDSPPLWHLSPASSPGPSYLQQQSNTLQVHEYDCSKFRSISQNSSTKFFDIPSTQRGEKMAKNGQRRSCSYVEGGGFLKKVMGCGDDVDQDDEEEKMDMLWEDLNEEASRNDGDSGLINLHGYSTRGGHSKLMEFGCVPTSFRFIKNSDYDGGDGDKKVVKSGKKPSAVVLMKVFRKLFLIHNHSQQSSPKKRS